MSHLEVPHEFFDTETRDNEQLYQAFCNHVHCGQWELARLTLEILHPRRLKLNTNLEELLIDIIRNPTAYCSESKAVSTPFHFALLLLEECRAKQYLEKSILESLKNEATFKFLLAVGDIQPTPQVVQEFHRLQSVTDVNASALLTDAMADFLLDLWLNEIPRVHALVRLYLNAPIPSVHLWLILIHKRALEQSLQQLKSLNNEEQKTQLVDLLLSLHFYSCESHEFRSTMRDILKKIVIYASEANSANGQLFNLKLLYRSVLVNEHLARLISELEAEYRRDSLGNDIVLIHFIKKNSFEKENMFWKELYLYLIENKLDLITCVLNDSISMMQNRDYSSLDQLLNIQELNALHIYIFLLCWTHSRTINDATVLLGSIRTLENKSPFLEKCLKLFQSHIDFIAWLSRVRRVDLYHDGATAMPNTSDLLALLHTSSPLSLIYRYFDNQNIDANEILQRIRTTAMNLVDDDEYIRDRRIPKSVRFEDEPEVDMDSLRLPQMASSMIYLGYLTINHVVQHVVAVDPNMDENVDLFATTKSYLTQIFPLRFRLEVLENIFSLIFIQQSELKLDDAIDIVEPCSRSVSTSLSNSEKLSLPMHGNSIEDSLVTSTNASIRPQLSFGRSIRELDDDHNNDDNVSVCSSSMSSAGASHPHGFYRSGVLIDQQVLHQLLNFVRDQITELKSLANKIKEKGIDRDTVTLETALDKFFSRHTIGPNEQFESRAAKLNTIVSEAIWRYRLLTTNPKDSSKQDNRTNGQENDDCLVNDVTIKNMILPLPVHRHRHRKQRRSRLSESSVSSATSTAHHGSSSKNKLVSQVLSSRDNLLAVCLKEGKITEANEVIRVFNMQDHPLAVEAGFSKLFRDTLEKLCQSYATVSSPIEAPAPTSMLAGLASLASSALGNSSLQSDINPLLEAAQSSAVASTLPTSHYFDHEHFSSLTLLDLAIHAPSMAITKTLLDMAQHRLPLSKSAFVPNSSSSSHNHSKSSASSSPSASGIKTLHELINGYLHLANASTGSLRDLLLDVTIPLEGNKASRMIQYYKRLEEHCRYYYANEKSLPIEQQVKSSSEFFENDPQAKFELIPYIKNGPIQTKPASSSYMNYFAFFHTYLQNFRLLLEQFPIQDLSSTADLVKYSPQSLVHRIVARSSDINLDQLQLMTKKLNIDISLAVTLSIIRPLFVDKNMVTSTSLATRQPSLLQQQPIDIFSYQHQSQQQLQTPLSTSTASLRRQMRRSVTLLRRLTSRGENLQSEPATFSENPDSIVRKLLTRLLDSIRRILQDLGQNHLMIEHVEKLTLLDDYDDILNALPLFSQLDLDLLATNEERICFFANLYNLLIIVAHTELIRTTYTRITTTNLFRNDLERLLFMLTTRLDVGQLKQVSLFDIRHYILRQTILYDGLELHVDAKGPFNRYAPKLKPNQHIKIGLLLNDCIYSSAPFVVLTPELVNEQLQRLTRDYIDKCVLIQTNETEKSMSILFSDILQNQFHKSHEMIVPFIGEYSSNNDVLCAINEQRTIKTQVILSRMDFAISLDYRACAEQFDQRSRRRRTSSSPTLSTMTTLSSSIDFLPPSNGTLPNHLIDARTIAFVQEKSPALGQILQTYVQYVVHSKPIDSDRSPLRTYFTSLLPSPNLIDSTSTIGDEWFRSIALNDLTYQHDLLLYLSSVLWSQSKYNDIVTLFDSLIPAFIVHSPYCQMLRDLALLSLIKQTSEPDRAYHYLRKVHDCNLLVRATIHYLPRFDGPTCLKLLQLCLTSCKKSHTDYVDWIQERLNVMYVYKTLCLGALEQFNKCMEKLATAENGRDSSIDEMAIKKTSGKCLTWQGAEKHSERDPLAVVDMFILEKQFDVGHKWLTLLKNQVDDSIINGVRCKLVEAHIDYLLEEGDFDSANKILQIIGTIEDTNKKWHLCKDLTADLCDQQWVIDPKSIPYLRLYIKFRIIQYMLEHFDENSGFFTDNYKRSRLSTFVTGLTLFFNCIPFEETDSYFHLVSQPLLIIEQLLMNSSIDVAKTSIEMLKGLIDQYSQENSIQKKQIDDLIEFYTKKSVKLNVVQRVQDSAEGERKTAPTPPSESGNHSRRKSLVPVSSGSTTRGNDSQEISPLGRRNASSGATQLMNTLRQRISSKPSTVSSGTSDYEASVASSMTVTNSPSANNRSTGSTAIPIKTKETPPQSSSFFASYLSSSFSGRTSSTDTAGSLQVPPAAKNSNGDFTVPPTATPKKLWVSDDEVSVCMCCKESTFSMFNRRHHCRHCGRVVCKSCSSHMTVINDRLERTCRDCYQHIQNNPIKTAPTATKPESNIIVKRNELLRPPTRQINPFKRKSITQWYSEGNRQSDGNSSMVLLGTSLVNDPLNIVHEEQAPLSSSFSAVTLLMGSRKSRELRSSQRPQTHSIPMPIINDYVHYVLTGTSIDEQNRKEFHYDQSPSISLCLSLIELHSDQYECGKILIKLAEYLSEQLSSKQRNMEIDYGLVLSIINKLIVAAKVKFDQAVVDDERVPEQQKFAAACDMYKSLVDILSRLNTINFPLPALNDFLQQDTARRIRNQLLDEEQYQLAIDISTRCNLDAQSIWFQWGMAYLHIGQFPEARDKFDKCLQRKFDRNEKLRPSNNLNQEKILNDIISYLESLSPLRYSVKQQYLTDQMQRQRGLTRANSKYLHNLYQLPPTSNQADSVIQSEIHFYLTKYSDDAHLVDYYIRHQRYADAFEFKCPLNVFRDHIYLPLLKRNQINQLFNYILTHSNHSLTHHLKYMCHHFKEQEMHHCLQQLQVFMNDYMNAAMTSIKIFTCKRTNYPDLCAKRLVYLQKALEYFKQATVDSEQTMTKIQSTKNRINLQIELTRYIDAQLKRLGHNGSNVFINSPTLFDGKEAVIKLVSGLISVADTMSNVFNLIHKIIQEMQLNPSEILIPCAEDIGRRRDYRLLQQLLQVMREHGYNEVQVHDEIIEACIRETGSDVEQSREQDTLIQMIKSDNKRIDVYSSVGKLRAAYLIAVRLGKDDKVRAIRDDAQRSGQTAVYDMCKKWLENRASEQ